MLEINTIFEKKTELLCNGLFFDEKLLKHYLNQGIEIDFGRKGGAGPLGGRYFLFENGSLVNIALWNVPKKSNLTLGNTIGDFIQIINRDSNEQFYNLKLIQNPKYYNPEYKTSDGIEMKKIALVHGVDCLASTIYQKCTYWACGEACKFCGIELSLENDTTIEEKNHIQMVEVIRAAKKESRCNHMTLTSGTEESIDRGANRYIELLKGIKESYPYLPLHVQIEPLENLKYIDDLKEAGADTIGIHLELLNDKLRSQITPGKYNIPYSLFKTNWEHSLNVFGKNQVSSYILTGFGETDTEFITNVEKIIAVGVIPFITPVRSIPGKLDLPVTDLKTLIKIYLGTAKMMKQYGVNPLENKAGCVRCGGCSAIKEAYCNVN